MTDLILPKNINGDKPKDKWLRDENGVIIEVPIAG